MLQINKNRVAILLVVGILVLSACSADSSSTGGGSSSGGSSNGSSGGGSSSGGSAAGLPAQSFKQTPKEITFNSCPGQGDGGDPVLNRNKNRVDDGNYQPTKFSAIVNLTWPPETERSAHADWSSSAAAAIDKAEGLPVLVEGYLALARQEGPETPNCHSASDFDFHIWMLDHAGGSSDRVGSIVIEATPRVRAKHPGWTVGALNSLAKNGTKIRVSGWVMLDPEHPDQVGKTRGTIWEIHPVMQIEVSQSGRWTPLDSYNP